MEDSQNLSKNQCIFVKINVFLYTTLDPMVHCGIQGGVGKDVKTTKPTSFVNNGGTFSNYD